LGRGRQIGRGKMVEEVEGVEGVEEVEETL